MSYIQSIEFALLSPMQLKKMAASEITKADIYDNDGFPIEGGVMDPNLGVVDPGMRCRTCGLSVGQCVGHFGYIELVRPIYNVLYGKLIYRLLKNICWACSKPAAGTKCPSCGTEQKKIRFEKPYTFYEDDKALTPLQVRERFEKISDEDLPALGVKGGRPEWVILTLFPVPPVISRPSITLETGERSEDDLTHKLVDIIRINQRLRENVGIGAPDFIIEDLWELLQYHTATFFDNELAGIPAARHRSGRPLKTLADRLKSKEGRFRQNLAGKRVNFSARTVISPDTHISIDEVGVPLQVAAELTIPVAVREHNIEVLRELLKTAPAWPSANYIVRPDGKKKKITAENREEIIKEIAPGYVVERHLRNGDVVLFNRQPSLHRMSIMAHKVRVQPWKTFTLNIPVCVAPDTKVLLGGTQRKIEELKNCWKESIVATYDIENKAVKTTDLKAFWGLKPEHYGETCFKIITETGREIVATGDHPFYTKNGVKPAKELIVGDKAVVYPTDFPEYEQVDFEIVSEKDIINSAPKETYIKYSLGELKSRSLIPMRLLNNPKAIILARLVGHIFGDGTLILKGDSARAIFRGGEKDLLDIQTDIKHLGFEPEKIITRKSEGEIRTVSGKVLKVSGSGSSFEVRSKPFVILLKALGAPNGDKVKSDFTIPQWVVSSPKYVKKEFLSAYFGCEMLKPKIRKASNKLFKPPEFKMSKLEEKLEAGISFAKDVVKALEEFGISAKIFQEPGNIRKDGKKTIVVKTMLKGGAENLINFFGKIGYAYNRQAETSSRLAFQYLKIKKNEIERKNKILKRALSAKRGEILKIAEDENMPAEVLYKWRNAKQKTTVASPKFSDFREWANESSFGNGFVLEKIKTIEPASLPYVYDITTVSETHNFIANGFLTGNCPPYNADFDGDEMNIHVPQTEEARAEAQMLMAVPKHIRSPRFGGPIIGCEQDHVSGCYLLTRKDTEIPRERAIQILAEVGLDAELPSRKTISGKEIFSAILPKGLNIEFRAKVCGCDKSFKGACPNDGHVSIKNGKLESGVIDKNAIGREAGKLIDRIEREFGSEEAHKFVDRVSLLGIKWLEKSGLSIGLDDGEISKPVREKIQAAIEKGYADVDDLIKLFREGKIEPLPGQDIRKTLEIHIRNTLSNTADLVGKIVKENLKETGIVVMGKTGARGSMNHIAQLTGAVGQEHALGERIHRGYRGRTLSHFMVGDLRPAAHGFVANSFKIGLTPFEFFFDVLSGREGLMDKSLRTRHSGYLERRLIGALQDLKIEYDGTVRDNRKIIIQFIPGEDGVDPSKSDWGKIDVKKIAVAIGAA